MIEANFRLRRFSVSLVNSSDHNEGLELFSRDFTIEFKKYDSNSDSTPHVFKVTAKNEEFGVN